MERGGSESLKQKRLSGNETFPEFVTSLDFARGKQAVLPLRCRPLQLHQRYSGSPYDHTDQKVAVEG